MAKITKLINFLNEFDNDLSEEIYNREDKTNDQEYKWNGYRDSEKGTEYIYKTEALDELKELIFEVTEKAEAIKNKDY
tara:strand:- start:1831 stop:2064 length:234 start_codon:yes stop_codon:yes gene_type:complete